MQNLKQMQAAMQSQGAPASPSPSPSEGSPMPATATAPDPAMAGEPAAEQGNPVEQVLNALPEEQKAFVAEHLTPEIAQLFGIVLGNPEITDMMSPFVDAERILVPVPRGEFQNLLQSQSAGADSAAPAAPSSPMVGGGDQPQQQAATPMPQGAGPV